MKADDKEGAGDYSDNGGDDHDDDDDDDDDDGGHDDDDDDDDEDDLGEKNQILDGSRTEFRKSTQNGLRK